MTRRRRKRMRGRWLTRKQSTNEIRAIYRRWLGHHALPDDVRKQVRKTLDQLLAGKVNRVDEVKSALMLRRLVASWQKDSVPLSSAVRTRPKLRSRRR